MREQHWSRIHFRGSHCWTQHKRQNHVISIFHDVFPRCFHGLSNCKARSWQVTQRKLWARPFSVSSAINSSPFFLLLLGFASYDVISVFVRFSRSLRISREENTNLKWGFKCHRCWWHLNTVSSMRERGRRGVPTMGAWESSTKLTKLNLLNLDVKNKLHDPRRWDPPIALHCQCFF